MFSKRTCFTRSHTTAAENTRHHVIPRVEKNNLAGISPTFNLTFPEAEWWGDGKSVDPLAALQTESSWGLQLTDSLASGGQATV